MDRQRRHFCAHYSGHRGRRAHERSTNISALMLSYVMQGIPLGIIAIIPNIIQESDGSFSQQAKFSLVRWAFALKIIVAPIMDSIYIEYLGRRKTWIVFMQFLMASFLMALSMEVENILTTPITDYKVTKLTIICFTLNLLVATQDIAVDCWALKMSKYTSCTYMCDVIGIFIGFFIGYIVIPSLDSPSFCNEFLRKNHSDDGIVTMSESLWYLGISYWIITTIVAFFSQEEVSPSYTHFGISESFRIFTYLFRSPAIQIFALILLTEKLPYIPYEIVNEFKLMQQGFTRTQLSILNSIFYLFQLSLPRYLATFVSSYRPLDSYFRIMPYRMCLSAVGAILTFSLPWLMKGRRLTLAIFVVHVIIGCYYKFCSCAMSIAKAKFFAGIADPALGGTNLSFLNALNSIGGYWPSVISLWSVDILNWKHCASPESCTIILDGYYVELLFSFSLGLLWLFFMEKCLTYLQTIPLSDWTIDFQSQ